MCSVWVAVSTQAIDARLKRRYRRPGARSKRVPYRALTKSSACTTLASKTRHFSIRRAWTGAKTSFGTVRRPRARAKRQPCLRSAVGATTKAQRSSGTPAQRATAQAHRRPTPTAAPRARSEAALHTSSSTESRIQAALWHGAARPLLGRGAASGAGCSSTAPAAHRAAPPGHGPPREPGVRRFVHRIPCQRRQPDARLHQYDARCAVVAATK